MTMHKLLMDNFSSSIIGADCCNFIEKNESYIFLPPEHKKGSEFVHPFSFSGHLIFCSALYDQPSYGRQVRGGSRFTRLFFGWEGTYNNGLFKGDWESALRKVKEEMEQFAEKQIPQYDPTNFTQSKEYITFEKPTKTEDVKTQSFQPEDCND